MLRIGKRVLARLVPIFLLAAVFFTGAASAANTNGADRIKVVLDGQILSFDVAPVNENGRVMVPMRAIFEALGAELQWDGAANTITATKDATTIILTLGKQTATVGGKSVSLAAPAKLMNERTFVPLRFVAEALGCEVNWDAATKLISIVPAPTPKETTPSIREKKRENRKDNYYINGKLVATATDGGGFYSGDGWTLWVDTYGSVPYRNAFGEVFIYYSFIKPNYLTVKSSSKKIDFPTDAWRTEPTLSKDQKEAIDFVLADIEAWNNRLRALK